MQFKTNQLFLWTLLALCPLSTVSQTFPGNLSTSPPRKPMDSALPLHPANDAFELRGTKGYFWTPAQYLEEIPILKSYGMNFLATCYGSFFRDYTFKEGHNDWWVEMDAGLKREWQQVIHSCRENGINFC